MRRTILMFFFFFSSRRRHTRSLRDWSSDVCSSDLLNPCPNVSLPAAAVQTPVLPGTQGLRRGEMANDTPMQLGMVGLGRMGANLVRRLMRDGHSCVVYDVDADVVKKLEAEGATGATSLEDFAVRLDEPRIAWLMLPTAIVDSTLGRLVPLLEPGDVVKRRRSSPPGSDDGVKRRHH